jgi:hypothetical protein
VRRPHVTGSAPILARADTKARYAEIRARYGRHVSGFASTPAYLADMAAEAAELRALFGRPRWWNLPGFRHFERDALRLGSTAHHGAPLGQVDGRQSGARTVRHRSA